ncbi:MAG: hypothetical protein KGY68_06635 [Candidatus Thermoplasmatota archaeon]|nr:hypothetical protein [Candidatus Thermoplasmatota archaeon]
MKFRTLFMAHTPEAEKEEHKAKIETEKYVLYVNLVRGQEEALKTAEEYAEKEGIQSIILCPGFTHEDVAEISESLDDVGVTVARGDGPSGRIAKEAMQKAGWFE